ncbi:MAG TPA: HAMP domain-containing protein [Candidatus Obscuribacterales bacterium]
MFQKSGIFRQSRFIGLRAKMLIGFTIIFTGIFAGTYYWFYRYASTLALERLRDNLVNAYRVVNAGIDGDSFEILLEQPLSDNGVRIENNSLYIAHQSWLVQITETEPRALAYTYIAGDNPGEIIWIGDAYRTILPDRSPTQFKESYQDEVGLYEGLSQSGVIMTPSQDEWGTWIIAYGPIYNSSGEIVGALGVDFSADYLRIVQRQVRMAVLLIFAIAYLVLILLVYLMARKLTKPITHLTEISERIGDGDYSQRGKLAQFHQRRLRDEITQLAAVFEGMVDKVYQREVTLKQQITELKIEIDHSKRQQQVQEIVDTDYFQGLQKKARMMRRNRDESKD